MNKALCILTAALLFASSVYSQRVFDSATTEKLLLQLPPVQKEVHTDENIISAIKAIDRKFREITDTLYSYKSLKHTLFQLVMIETNDSIFINPLLLGNELQTENILFWHPGLKIKTDSIANSLPKEERLRFIRFLQNNFDAYSENDKALAAQPVRIRYIRFSVAGIVHAGIDIYGAHFLWTIEKDKNWAVTAVEKLWVY